MSGAITIIIIIFVSVTAIVLGSVWMGTSYAAKKRGLTKGVTNREHIADLIIIHHNRSAKTPCSQYERNQ